MRTIFAFAIFILQFINFQVSVLGSEILKNQTSIEYASGWTGSGLASDINTKLDLLQISADLENKSLNIKDVKITPEWGYAFILYEVSNKTSRTTPVSTHVQYASGWAGPNLASDINTKLKLLQSKAKKEKEFLNIKNVIISPEWGYAFILYELSKPFIEE